MPDRPKATIEFYEALQPLRACNYESMVDETRWDELAIALSEISASPEHARAIVHRFVRTERYDRHDQLVTGVPEPIELRAFARNVSDPAQPQAPAPCGRCEDLPGWKLIERANTEMRDYCDCPRGQWQRAAMRKEPGKAERKKLENMDWAKRAAGDLDV